MNKLYGPNLTIYKVCPSLFRHFVQWNLPNPPLVRIRKICRIRKLKCTVKRSFCVHRLCRVEVILDCTGVGLNRFHFTNHFHTRSTLLVNDLNNKSADRMIHAITYSCPSLIVRVQPSHFITGYIMYIEILS